MSQESEDQSMYGWLICRFDRKQIHSILYGQFSRQQLPPSTGWVFLAKDAADIQKESDIMKLSKEGLDGKSLSLFAKGVDADDLAGCINSVTGSIEDGISVNAAFLQNDKEPGAPTTRYYVLRNCPIPAVNGRYMEGGFHEGAPLYRNVREWALIRTKLAEMPELGITAKGSYAIQEGASISEIYHEAAATAYEELLHNGDNIKDGSYDFKKRFIALSRAGNRMVTSDQSMQLYFINQKRAALRTKLSDSLLLSLQAVRLGTAPTAEGTRTLASTTTITADAGGGGSEGRGSALVSKAELANNTVGRSHDIARDSQSQSQQPQPLSRSNVPTYMNETLESCAPDTIKTSTSSSSSSSAIKQSQTPQQQQQQQQHNEDHSSIGQSAATETDNTEVGVEIDITLGRSISYQAGSQGFVLNRLVTAAAGGENRNSVTAGAAAGAGGGGTGTGAFEDQQYLDAESELAREVTVCIEEREAAVAALKMEAAMLARDFTRGEEEEVAGLSHSQFNQSVYGGSGGGGGGGSHFASALNTARSSAGGDSFSPTTRSAVSRPRSAEHYLQRVEPLLEKMREVRRLTVAFADAFGAWVRLLHKQKAAKWRREKKKAEQFGGSFKKMNRSYVVVIAQRSSQELYALSQAVNSSVKKYSRDMEPVKFATEIKLIGVYDTKDEAIAAFDRAFGEIPSEYMLLSDIKAVNKKLIGLRRCGQHYIVRSSGVPQEMECEQCALLKQQQAKAAAAVPELYKEEPISQYIWNGSNYLEKMWTDLDFLAEVEFLKRALPDENFKGNPLLLSNASVQELLHSIHEHKRAGKTSSANVRSGGVGGGVSSSGGAKVVNSSAEPRHPLNSLRGRQEQLRDAARAGDRHNASIKQRAHELKYRDDPYNNTAFFGSLKDRTAAREASATAAMATDTDPADESQINQQQFGGGDDFLFAPGSSSVFYETTVGSLGSDFGQPVEVHEVSRSNYQNSEFSSRGGTGTGINTGRLYSGQQTTPGGALDASVLTSTSMRASQSAPVLLDNNKPSQSQSNKSGSLLAGTVAGNGAAGVKGIKSAAVAKTVKVRDKYSSTASPYAPTVTDVVPLPVAPKRSRVLPHAENVALLSTTGLDLNKYLSDELRASTRSASSIALPASTPGAASITATAFQLTPMMRNTNQSNQLATRWDEDYLQDSEAHRERLARALQVIGQCPVPENAIRSTSPASASASSAALRQIINSGGTSNDNGGQNNIAGSGSSAGPEAFSATIQPGNGNGGGGGGGGGFGKTSSSLGPMNQAAASPTKKAKMTLVESFYAYRGAQMSIVQERRAVAHRTEETFCRSDVGEWKGLTKGRAMRAFEFQENLFNTGKKLEEDRMHLQQLIRAALAVDIIHCDVPYIQDLVVQAQKMRGASMLALDIAQAEIFLRQYRAVCKYALRGQCWFRGQRDRHLVREMRRKIREQKKHFRTTEIEVAKLAPLLVADFIKGCVQAQVNREKRSFFRFTLNMTGVLCMVSLRRQTAPVRKPVTVTELCAGCSTQCIISKFQLADRTYSKDRAPCTCVYVTPQEEWQLNIYNPLNRETFQHTVSVAQARQMLRGIESAAKYMLTPQYAYASMVGPSFGNLTPLFGPPPDTGSQANQQQCLQDANGNSGLLCEPDDAFSGRRLDRSYSMAMLNAAAESAVLPRLPHCLPPRISELINTAGIHHYRPSPYSRTCTTTPARRVAGFNRLPMLDGCKAAEVLSDQDGPFDPQWDWRPLYDMNVLEKEIARNIALSEDFKQAMVAAEHEVQLCAESKVAAYKDIEQVQIIYEDARSAVLRVQIDIDTAARRIEEVMRFGKQLEAQMRQEEAGQTVNDRQSHDEFENASSWVGLNQKRKLEKLHVALFQDCESKCKAFLSVNAVYESACATLQRMQVRYEAARIRFERHRPVIQQRRAVLREMQVEVRAAANALLMTYSLPRKHASTRIVPEKPGIQHATLAKYTKSRRLQRIPWNLIFVRDPLERLRLQNRAPLTVLQRRVMKLTPQQRTLDKRIKGHLRCVVLVLLDEVTGLMVLHVGQSEAVVEESNQHIDLDLHKSDFSDLTSHGLENDIILKPEDVDWLLSIPVEMSSENLTRANKYSKSRIMGLVPDPNKLALQQHVTEGVDLGHSSAETPQPRLVLPSQALRPLSSVNPHPVYNNKLRALKSTYVQRRDEKERHQIQRADQLLRYLRLQAHTGRPCVGLLHFRRRLEYSHQHITTSSWLSDLVNADPLILINHLSSKTFMLNDDIVMVHSYNNMRKFNIDLQLPFPVHPLTVNIEVSLQQVITRLQAQPLLLASFLWEFVTNTFTAQTLVRLFQDIDWELPGQLSRSYWRRPGPDEIPRPHFLLSEQAKYRGPVYQRHRFVSSRYFLAKLFLSVQGDLRISLMPPEDGKFHHHQYAGETLHVDISRAELCVIVAKLSVNANLVPIEMFGTVLLLHHHNVHLLFSILLEMVHLTLHQHHHHRHHHHHHHHNSHAAESAPHHSRHRPHKHRKHSNKLMGQEGSSPAVAAVSGQVVLSALNSDGSQLYDVAVNLGVLFNKTVLLFEKYNNWVSARHPALLCPLQEECILSLQKYVGRFSLEGGASAAATVGQLAPGEVDYKVMTEKDPTNKQQMRVYHSVWSFLDLDKFFGDPRQPLLLQYASRLMRSRKGASFRALKQLKEGGESGAVFPSYTMGSDCFDTLMGVEVLTNVAKTKLLIDISTINLSHSDAQAVVNQYEQGLFQQEDELSRDHRVYCALTEAKLSLTREFQKLNAHLHNTLLPEQEKQARKSAQALEYIATMQKQFTTAFDECSNRHSRTVLQHALSVLFAAGSTDAPYQLQTPSNMQTLTSPIRVPMFLQSEALLVEAADWMNDMLKKQRQALTSVTPAAVRLECRQSQGEHLRSGSEVAAVATERRVPCTMPGFTTATMPRLQVPNAYSGASRLEQLGAEFRDPDRWYYAKRLNGNARVRNMQSYQTYVQSNSSPGAAGPSAAAAMLSPPGRSAAPMRELNGKKLFSGATLSAVLSRDSITGADGGASQASPLTLAPDDLFALLDSTTYANGVAGIDLFSLTSHTVVRLYAFCNSNSPTVIGNGEASQVSSADQLLEQRATFDDVLKYQVEALQSLFQTRSDSLCEEISVTIADAARLQDTFSALSAETDLTALQAIARESSAARSSQEGIDVASLIPLDRLGESAEWGGSPFSMKRKDKDRGKSSKNRRGRQRTRSAEWEEASMPAEASHQQQQSGSCAFPVTAFYIPADESQAAEHVSRTTADWQDALAQYLVVPFSESDSRPVENVLRLHRRLCAFGIIYWRQGVAASNARVQRLLDELDAAGQVKGGRHHRPHDHGHHHHHHAVHAPEITGDVVILLRHGQRDCAEVERLLFAMQEEYAPMKALRLLKEGKERQWRLSNHAKFRQLVFGLAYPCLNATENLYGVHHVLPSDESSNPFKAPVPRVHTMPLFQLRLLLTKFNDLLKCFHAHLRLHNIDAGRHWRALEFSGLLDYCQVCDNDAILVHFDEKCPDDVDFGDFGRRSSQLRAMVLPVQQESLLRELQQPDHSDNDEEPELYDANKYFLVDGPSGSHVSITAGQVVYAMFQLHCYNCSTPMHLCRFPGCSYVRAEAAASWSISKCADSDRAPFLGVVDISPDLSAGVPALADVRGSGQHPVDVAIKQYFLNTSDTFVRFPALYLPGHHAPHIPTDKTDDNGEDDAEIDDEEFGASSAFKSADAHATAAELSVEEEVAAEQLSDQMVLHKRDTDVKLKLRYEELKEEAALLYALHHAMVRREMTDSVTFRELLMAKGGIYAVAEEASIRKLITKVLVTHTASANSEYAAYDSTAARELLRLVPSAALLEEIDADAADGDLACDDDTGGDSSARSPSEGSSGEGGSEESSSSAGSSENGEDDDDFSASTEGTSVTSTEKLTLQAVVHVKQTHSIPIDILQALSRAEIAAVGGGDDIRHEQLFDPYPPLVTSQSVQPMSVHHQVNPMPTAMYDVLMRRLRLTRANRIASQPNYSAAAPSAVMHPSRRASSSAALVVNEKESHYFRFDRLHHEQVVVLQDGSVVVVQFLHGILQGASLVVIQPKKSKKKTKLSLFANNDVYPNIEVYENISGSPPAALRFIHTSKLPTVKPGLTVAVFDALSTVSRAFIIEQRSIKRTCEAFGVNVDDYTGLAKRIGSLAHQCIQVTRAGLYCTTVMFSVASLHDESAPLSLPRDTPSGASPPHGIHDKSLAPSSQEVSHASHSGLSINVLQHGAVIETDSNMPTTRRYHESQTPIKSRLSAITDLISEMENDENF